jgi:hypothetical protein
VFTNHRPWLRFIVEPDATDGGTPAGAAPGTETPPASEDHSGEDSGTDHPTGWDDAGDKGGADSGDAASADNTDALSTVTAERDALAAQVEEFKRAQMTESEKVTADRDAAVKRAEDAEAKIAALNREKLVAAAAASANLPASMADRLRGETPEELAADAKALAASMGYDRGPIDPSQGKDTSGGTAHSSLSDALSAHYGTGTSR